MLHVLEHRPKCTMEMVCRKDFAGVWSSVLANEKLYGKPYLDILKTILPLLELVEFSLSHP